MCVEVRFGSLRCVSVLVDKVSLTGFYIWRSANARVVLADATQIYVQGMEKKQEEAGEGRGEKKARKERKKVQGNCVKG